MKAIAEAVALESAKKVVKERFPFPGYIDNAADIVENIAGVICSYIGPGSRVLDFGCGPMDKTAVIQCLGYVCSGYDDLQDEWHRADDNLLKIRDFAKGLGIDFRLASDGSLPFEKDSFDMVMSHDVMEHLHDSPRGLLNDLGELLKPDGILFITMPNAGSLVHRVNLLTGKTNLPDFAKYYWYPGPWRGHVREYVKNDLILLAEYLGFKVLEVRGCHHFLSAVPRRIRPVYKVITQVFPNLRDSWTLVCRKPPGWSPKRSIPRAEFVGIMAKGSPYYKNRA